MRWPGEKNCGFAPKCATDLSFAIAHSVEDVFWVEAATVTGAPASPRRARIEKLVRERTSPAVKAALKILLEAPVATTGGSKKARKGKPHA